MLRKEDSNKILKGIKTIVFATGLTLLNPINVEAQTIKQDEIIMEDEGLEPVESLMIILGISTLMYAGGLIAVAIDINKWKKELDNNYNLVYLGKLSSLDENDDVNKMVKYLKLTNGLEVK